MIKVIYTSPSLSFIDMELEYNYMVNVSPWDDGGVTTPDLDIDGGDDDSPVW